MKAEFPNMKKSLMTLSLLALATFAQAATVAVVNGEKVDSSDVERYEKLIKSDPQAAKAPEKDVREMAFIKLVEDKVLITEARKRGLDKKPEYTKQISEIESSLKEQGADKDALYKDRWLLTQYEVLKRFLADDVFSKQKGDEKLAKEIMESFNEQYKGSKFYHFERIAIQQADDLKKAYDDLKKNVEFKEVKKKYDVMKENPEQIFTLNSKDLEIEEPKLGKELAKIKPGTYNKEAVSLMNFKFIFKMDKVEDFKPATFDKDKKNFVEQSRVFNTEMYLANLLRDSKFEAKDDKYKFYGDMLDEVKKQTARPVAGAK